MFIKGAVHMLTYETKRELNPLSHCSGSKEIYIYIDTVFINCYSTLSAARPESKEEVTQRVLATLAHIKKIKSME